MLTAGEAYDLSALSMLTSSTLCYVPSSHSDYSQYYSCIVRHAAEQS